MDRPPNKDEKYEAGYEPMDKFKLGGLLLVTVILGLMVSTIVTGWDDVKEGYESSKNERELLESEEKDVNEYHDELLIETLQITKSRYDEKYKAIKSQEQPNVVSLEELATQLSTFKTEIINSKQSVREDKTVGKLNNLETAVLLMQKGINTMIAEGE